MEQPLALLACSCLLVFKWTCSHPETSRTVSLLSHFCSLGLDNIESQACVRGCSHMRCWFFGFVVGVFLFIFFGGGFGFFWTVAFDVGLGGKGVKRRGKK